MPPATDTPHLRQQTYRQFCLDANRITLRIDGIYDPDASPSTLYTWVVNRFEDARIGLWFAYWCTQTALAPLYCRKLARLNCGRMVTAAGAHNVFHLLDNGRQTIDIIGACDRTSVLHLTKPFRVVRQTPYAHEHEALYDYVLHVWVRALPLGTYTVRWVKPVLHQPLEPVSSRADDELGASWMMVTRSKVKSQSQLPS